MNDNSTSPIKFTPAKDGFYRPEGSSSKPTGSPRGFKNFKKMLSKGQADIEDDDDHEKIAAVDNASEDSEASHSFFELSKEIKGEKRMRPFLPLIRTLLMLL